MSQIVRALIERLKENIPDLGDKIAGATDEQIVQICAKEWNAVPPAHLSTDDAAQFVLAKVVADNQ